VGSVKELVDILNRYLLKSHAKGKRVVLIVDEAQNLAPEVLEQVRLLTNLETETQKLLQIILIGQPELRDMLARNDLRQLAQRITGRYHLDPLSRDESAAYVKHRLRVAGATTEIFAGGALTELYRVSGGVPRLINIIGDRALLGGYSQDRHRITGWVGPRQCRAASSSRCGSSGRAPSCRDSARRQRAVRAAVRAVVGALCGRLRRCVLAGAAAGTRMPERDRRHRGAAPLQPPGAAGAGR
jgi:general secretion pathway protein A